MVAINAIGSDYSHVPNGAIMSADTSSPALDQSYSRYEKSAPTSSDNTTMSFDDFVDMINPLQHIPVVSSIYRAVTGETINPISRIAGDTMYGGIFGLASAGLAAIGSIADEVVAANNDGKTVSDTVVAALFGNDADKAGDQTVQLADAGPSPKAEPQIASLQTPARQSPILQIPDLTNTPTAIASPPLPAASDPIPGTITLAAKRGTRGKAMPLDRTKLAYGGVMDTSLVQNAQQNQTMALAMSGQNGILQAQRAMRNSRFAVASMPIPGSTPATAPIGAPVAPPQSATAAAAQIQTTPQTQAAMQSLIHELQAMKGLSQYKSAAQSTPVQGSILDTAN